MFSLKVVVGVTFAELSAFGGSVVVLELPMLGGSDVVELTFGNGLATVCTAGIEFFTGGEHAETSHITVVVTANPHPTITFLHLAISLTPGIYYFCSGIKSVNQINPFCGIL
jgi:hypothetical protein